MADPTGETTIVGADSHFKGELTFKSTAKINGTFEGQINGEGELQVSQNAQCKADVNAAAANVDGTVQGNLQAKDTVRLNANGVVRGDITAAKMVMAEGAAFYGMCAVGPEAQKQTQQGKPQGNPQQGQGGQSQGDKK